jgi:myo-inositol-1(or 4)-monophosphatase
MTYIDFIKTHLTQAGEIARVNFGTVQGKIKETDANQVLTETDVAIGSYLIEQIEKTYPNHSIIDEEAGVIDKKSPLTWVIDPIDGTSNFADGVPTYGCMLGLMDNFVPIAGGVFLPAFDELYLAEKGKGTYCNGERSHVTEKTDIRTLLVSFGFDGKNWQEEIVRQELQLIGDIGRHVLNIRSSNSCFDVCMLAKGGYGAWFTRSTKVWDNIALQILVEEAGGVYTDFFGKPLSYADSLKNPNKNYTVCAGSPVVHEKLQGFIGPYQDVLA